MNLRMCKNDHVYVSAFLNGYSLTRQLRVVIHSEQFCHLVEFFGGRSKDVVILFHPPIVAWEPGLGTGRGQGDGAVF